MSIYKGNTLISRIKTGGGIYGTALANQVLTGYTVGTDSGLIDGSMANKTGTLQAAVPENPEADTSIRVAIPASGYYDTTSKLYFFVGDLLSANIKAGKNILGVQGSSSVLDTSDATVPDGSWLLEPVTAYKNGSKITGTMPDRRTLGIDTNRTEGIVEFKYPDPTYGDNAFIRFKADTAGYIDQNTIIRTLINNLSPANIKAGAKVGKYPLTEAGCYITGTFTSDATAVDADVVSGQTYYRNGVKGTGTIVKKTAAANYTAADFYAAGGGQILVKPDNALYVPGGTSATPGMIGGWIGITDADFTAANIPADKNIFGLQGTMPIRGSEEYAGWRRASYGEAAATTGRVHLKIPSGVYRPGAGNYDAGANFGVFYDDANFVPANIKSGVNVMGQIGSYVGGKYSVGDSIAPSSLAPPPAKITALKDSTGYSYNFPYPMAYTSDDTDAYVLPTYTGSTVVKKMSIATATEVWSYTYPKTIKALTHYGSYLFGLTSDGYIYRMLKSTGAVDMTYNTGRAAGTYNNMAIYAFGNTSVMWFSAFVGSGTGYILRSTTLTSHSQAGTVSGESCINMFGVGTYVGIQNSYNCVIYNTSGTYLGQANGGTTGARWCCDPTSTQYLYCINFDSGNNLLSCAKYYWSNFAWAASSASISSSGQLEIKAYGGKIYAQGYYNSYLNVWDGAHGTALTNFIPVYSWGFNYTGSTRVMALTSTGKLLLIGEGNTPTGSQKCMAIDTVNYVITA